MKKIAIDCRCFVSNSGISRYLDNILANILFSDSDNLYFLICPRHFDLLDKFRHVKNVIIVELNVVNDFIYKFFAVSNFLKKERVNVYWTPTQDSLFLKANNLKIVITVHDISFEHHRSWFGLRMRLMSLLGVYKYFLKRSDFLFYDSKFTKDDVERTYQIHKPGIVTHLGVSEQFKKIEKNLARRHVADRLHIQSRYIFYVDTVRFQNLFKAFSIFLSEERNKDVLLVCIGLFEYQDLLAYAKELHIESNVVWLRERVSDEDLNNLYAAADFFVCPSEYEGFGLTPLESLQSGTSVMVSNATSLPEVFEDAAVYCDPYDSDDIYEKMRLLSGNSALQSQLLSNAQKLLQRYNWKDISNKVLSALNSM